MTSITRRSLLKLSSCAALLGLGSAATRLVYCAAARHAELDSDLNVERTLLRSPVQVPSDFLGMHLHRWPQGSPLSPEPTYRYGSVRSHDYSGTSYGISWPAIHLAEHTYNWSQMDLWVRTHHAQNRTLIYTVYGTPAWLATSTTQKDAYGRAGAGYPPAHLGSLGQFITALIERYNTGSSRRQSTQAIRFIEIWNEPHFNHSQADFWWGTASQLAAMGRIIYQAARASDPSVRILSPGFDANLSGTLRLRTPTLDAVTESSLYQYLSADDGAGGQGRDWIDAIAFHTYEASLAGSTIGTEQQLMRLRAMLRLMRIDLPVYCTECGFRPDSDFEKSSPAAQATTLRRLAALLAASQVQGLYYYAHDDGYIGNPSLHAPIALALDQVHSVLAGSYLQQVTVHPDGSFRIETRRQAVTW